jgi:hypothetical protein
MAQTTQIRILVAVSERAPFHSCGQIGAGHSIEEVLAAYPYLERADVLQALHYAAWLAEDREVTLPRA